MGITLCDRADVCCCLEGINIRSLLWRCCSRAAPPEPPEQSQEGELICHMLSSTWTDFSFAFYKSLKIVLERTSCTCHWASETHTELLLNQVQVHETCRAEARASTCESLPATWTLASIQWRSSWRKSSTSHSEIFTIKRSTLTQRSISEDVK